MKVALFTVAIALLFLSGCSSVPMTPVAASDEAKQFAAPKDGNSGLYIYRSGSLGGALKKDVWVDDKCIGETAPNVFFYEEVLGDRDHKITTESEFSPNHLIVKTESGKNYFVKQFIKIGLFVGGADLKLVDEEKGKADVTELGMAIKGNCSK